MHSPTRNAGSKPASPSGCRPGCGATVVCAAEWETFVADAVVETHDRIVGRTYRKAARTSKAQLGDETAAVREALDAVIANRPG